jgi:DNA-directed RNA polymerase specialized sigma24 family protein
MNQHATTVVNLQALVHRTARNDRQAFAELFRTLSAATTEHVETAFPDAADVTAVVATTFMEVWWLAATRDVEELDVRGWIFEIADRHTAERRSTAGSPLATPQHIHRIGWRLPNSDQRFAHAMAARVTSVRRNRELPARDRTPEA